jgi:hypothetical protein
MFIKFSFTSIYSEEYYKFTKAYLPPNIEFEKKRTICFFQFRNEANDKNLEYLSKGIPGVIASSLRNLKYTFDPNPIPLKIQYEFGQKPITPLQNSSEYSIDLDPRYIKIDLEIINGSRPILKEEALSEGKNKSCFYIVSGEYKIPSSDSLLVQIEITESKSGTTKLYTYKVSQKRSFQELGELLTEIKSGYFFTGSSNLSLDISEKDVFVYLDGELYGKTPIVKSPILPGTHKILLIKEGYHRLENTINITHGVENHFNFKIDKIINIAKITIYSSPKDVDIYIGNKFIGKTPIENYEVPLGQNRVKASKDGYIDKFSSIDIRDSKLYLLNFNLKEGDSDLFYKYSNNLFLNYSYTDFGNFSLLSSILFYGIYAYNGYKETTEKDKLNGRAIFNSITVYQGINLLTSNDIKSQNLFLTSAFYQQSKINEVENSTAIYRQGQQIGIGGVVTMLALSGYFFYTGFNSESFEIGFKPSVHPLQQSEASFKYNLKF